MANIAEGGLNYAVAQACMNTLTTLNRITMCIGPSSEAEPLLQLSLIGWLMGLLLLVVVVMGLV